MPAILRRTARLERFVTLLDHMRCDPAHETASAFDDGVFHLLLASGVAAWPVTSAYVAPKRISSRMATSE